MDKIEKTVKYPTHDLLIRLDTLVSSFNPDLPEYVHSDVTISALYQLVAMKDPEQYFQEAPDDYIPRLYRLFPSSVEVDLSDKMVVGSEDNEVPDGATPFDVSEPLRLICIWGSEVLVGLVDALKLGAIKVDMAGEIDNPDFSLSCVLH